MKDDSLSKLGGTCSILVGVFYALGAIAYLLQPAELQAGADLAQFWPALAQNPTMNTLLHWAFALVAVFAIAAVAAISEIVRPANEGWVRWTSGLAYLGYAAMAITNFRALAVYRTLAAAYVAGDASVQTGIGALGYLLFDLDPQGWLGFGGVGLWFLVVNLLALRIDTWARTLAYVGIIGAILYWLMVAGAVLEISLLVAIAAGVGLIVGPIWFIWTGLRLRWASS